MSSRRSSLAALLRFLRAETHVLQWRPWLLFQQAANQPATTAPAEAAAARLAAGRERRRWLRWLNRPSDPSPCLLTLSEPRGAVEDCAISPDGRWLVSCSLDGLRLWDAESGVELGDLQVDGAVCACSVAPDGRQILAVTEDGPLRLWDSVSLEEVVTFEGGHGRSTNLDRFSFLWAGACLATISNDEVRVWDRETGSLLTILAGEPLGTSVTSAMVGGRLAAGGGEVVQVFDLAQARLLAALGGHAGRQGREAHPPACALSPDGLRLLTGDAAGTLRLWDLASQALLWSVTTYLGPVVACAFSPDGALMLGASEHVVRVWETASRRETYCEPRSETPLFVCRFTPLGDRIVGSSGLGFATTTLWDLRDGDQVSMLSGELCDVSPDGRRLLTRGSGTDQTLYLWDAQSGEAIAVLPGHGGTVNRGEFFPDGRRVVSSAGDGTVRVWDAGSRRERAPAHQTSISTCAFSPDGRRLATGSVDGEIRIWDGQTGNPSQRFNGHWWRPVLCCGFSPDGARLVSSSLTEEFQGPGWLLVFDCISGCVSQVLLDENGAESCGYSPDGGRIFALEALAGQRPMGRLWNADGACEPVDVPGHREYGTVWAFSPDGRLLALASGNDIELWDSRSATLVRRLPGSGAVRACDFSPAGDRLLWGDAEGRLELVEVATGARRLELRAAEAPVRHCSFSPGGGRILSASGWSLWVWDATSGSQLLALEHGGRVSTCGYSADGQYLWGLSRSDAGLRVWRANNGEPEYEWIAPNSLTVAVWSPTAAIIATGDSSGALYLLRPEGV